MNSMTESSKL